MHPSSIKEDAKACCHSYGDRVAHNKSVKKAKYICPMCKGVESDKPGDCSKCGMPLELASLEPMDEHAHHSEKSDAGRFWIGLALTIPVAILGMGMHVPQLHQINFTFSVWIQMLLTTPVVFWTGWPLLTKGWRSLVNRQLNMFTLISLGIIVSYFYSVIAVLFPSIFPEAYRHHGLPAVYFESAAVITVLVLLGQILEAKARSKTTAAIRGLLKLAPTEAHLLRDGQEVTVPLDSIQVGDHLRIKPGENVPVDGVVLEGTSSINESMLTGEAISVLKKQGDQVIAGTINDSGSLVIEAKSVGHETVLSQIVHMVLKAQSSRAPIQRFADVVSSYFVPIVILVAVLTFTGWYFLGPEPRLAYAVINAVAVLIIACPCAIGLATPMSLTVGIGKGASAGIYFRNAEALEILGKARLLLVDKTGTLTIGHPQVNHVITRENADEKEGLHYAAAIEINSSHPLATAVVTAAKERGIFISKADRVEDFKDHPGKGVSGKINGKKILLGNYVFLGEKNVLGLSDYNRLAKDLPFPGQTYIYLAVDDQFHSLLVLSDALRPSSKEAAARFKSMGIRTIMLTGDNKASAQAVAQELQLDGFHAELRPEDKQALVQEYKKKGTIVAMVGDGINDAPALASADVSIAMGSGTALALETAGITLIKSDLNSVVQAIVLSKKTLNNIRQNLGFSMLYNLLGIPIAAGVLYPWYEILLNPMIGSVAMTLSSISVIINSLRLKGVKLHT